ncbi:MAG: hypothetical protein WEC15_08265 [Flavobacteriales bacterium]
MHRLMLVILLALLALTGSGQTLAGDTVGAIGYSRSVSVPLNAYQLYDKAMDAWTWTFGKEPGAVLRRSDRESGMIEGTARVNFRSTMLTGREESMGTITYRVTIQLRAGGSRITVNELVHSGNKTALRGGIHLGVLARGSSPQQRIPGLGRANTERLYAEVKELSHGRVTQLMQAFEARLRANAEP